jgi:hypothetical protein
MMSSNADFARDFGVTGETQRPAPEPGRLLAGGFTFIILSLRSGRRGVRQPAERADRRFSVFAHNTCKFVQEPFNQVLALDHFMAH